MKFKIPFRKDERVDVQSYFTSSKMLDTKDKIRKQNCLDSLCNLIDLQELGYRNAQGNSLISIRKEENYLLIEISDDAQEV